MQHDIRIILGILGWYISIYKSIILEQQFIWQPSHIYL